MLSWSKHLYRVTNSIVATKRERYFCQLSMTVLFSQTH